MTNPRNNHNLSIDNLQKLEHGVLLVSCKHQEIASEVTIALIEQAAVGGNATGTEFPQVNKIRLFIPGASSQIRYYAARMRMARPIPKNVTLETIRCGSNSKFDFLGNEGRIAILPYIHRDNLAQSPHLNIFMLEVGGDDEVQLADAIAQYRMAAQKSNGYVVMVLLSHQGFVNRGFEEIVDEFCEVDGCEADPDYDTSFSFDFHGLKHLNRYGVGKVMCSSRMVDAAIEFKYDRFISDDVEDRTIWFLRAAGKSYAEIGKQLGGLNKATVMRRLRQMPIVIPQTLDTDFVTRLMENIAVEKQEAKVLELRQDEDDEDLDGSDDD